MPNDARGGKWCLRKSRIQMKLHEVYEAIQPSIVAFEAAAVPSHEGDSAPRCPTVPKVS